MSKWEQQSESIEKAVKDLETDIARMKEQLADWQSPHLRTDVATKKLRQVAHTIVVDAQRIEALVKESASDPY